MTKTTIRILLVLAAVAGLAVADTVNFAGLPGPINIMTPSGVDVSGVRFQYDPGGGINPPPACVFDAGAGGVQYDFVFGCVGAQVDTSGLSGTSDGTYIITFGGLINGLSFNFGIVSFEAIPPDPGDFGVFASFFDQNGNLTDVLPVPGDGTAGPFIYSGPLFEQVQLNFGPSTQVVPGNPIPPMYGQTLITVSNVTYTPEPSGLILLLSGLGGLSLCTLLKRGWRK